MGKRFFYTNECMKTILPAGTSMHLKTLSEPGFVRETLKNVTVPEGRDVLLSCTVKNLDGHKVKMHTNMGLFNFN